MSTWIWSGRTALIWGTVAFIALFLPALAWQYRRYGVWNARRMIGTAAACVYLVAVATYTWLPLPPRSQQWCDAHAVTGVGSVPFHSVGDIAAATAKGGVINFALLQVIFNVVLFVPWGVLVRGFLHRGVGVAVLTGFAGSLLVEATQLTGLWFLYPCAYRFADVDDLITNTLGALIGALIAPALLWWMPRARRLAAARLTPRPVTWQRRWLGMVIDAVAWFSLSVGLTIPYSAARVALGYELEGPFDAVWLTLSVWVPTLVVFWWPAWSGGPGGGGSAGHNAVWLTPAWTDPSGTITDGGRWRRLLRASVVAVPWSIAATLMPGRVATIIGLVLVVASFASVLLTHDRRGLSYTLTGARLRDIRDPDVQQLGSTSDGGQPALSRR